MIRPRDVLDFIDHHNDVLWLYDWITAHNGEGWRRMLKGKHASERPKLKAWRHWAFTHGQPDPGKFWMAWHGRVDTHWPLPDDFFGAEALCEGDLCLLEAVPDLERPGNLVIKGRGVELAHPMPA